MVTNYKTSLYIANLSSPLKNSESRKEAVFNYVKEKTMGDNLIHFDSITKDILIQNSTGIDIIRFVTNYIKPDKLTLTFFPVGSNVDKPSNWKKEKIANKLNTTLNFCDRLGDRISLLIDEQSIVFNREMLGEPELNLGNLSVDLKNKNPEISLKFSDFMSEFKRGQGTSDYIELKNIPVDVFTDGGGPEVIEKLSFLKPIFSLEYKGDFSLASNLIPNYDKTRLMLFVGKEEIIKKWHEINKLSFSLSGIATQCILEATLDSARTNQNFYYQETNIINEMLTKLGKQPVILKPYSPTSESDGFLLLSDIEKVSDKNQNLFGVLALFREKSFQKNFVKVLDNIDYTVYNKKIKINQENTNKLLDGIKDLIPTRSNWTLLFTRRPSIETLDYILKSFADRGINVKKVQFISNKTASFVSSRNNQSYDDYNYTGRIISKNVGFLIPSNNSAKYWCIRPFFIENLWPEDLPLSKEDMYNILWLIKKRTYRMSNLSLITMPEPVAVINNINHLNHLDTQNIELRFLL